MILTEGTFYKLQLRILQSDRDLERLQAAAEKVLQQRKLAFVEAGLDATKPYRLVEETLSALEQPEIPVNTAGSTEKTPDTV